MTATNIALNSLIALSIPIAQGQTVAGPRAVAGLAPVNASLYPSLAAAVTAAGDNGTILLPPGYNTTIASTVKISGTNVQLLCQNGSTITKNFRGTGLLVTGRNIVVDNCSITGAPSSSNSDDLQINGASDVRVSGGSYTNSGAQGGITIYRSSRVRVTGVSVFGGATFGIFAQDNLDEIEIDSNIVDTTSATVSQTLAIGVHTFAKEAYATHIKIHDNKIIQGGDDFCIEVGAFGGLRPTGIEVANNMCKAAATSTGMVSLASVSNGVMTGNIFDQNNQTITVEAFELAASNNITASANIQYGAPSKNIYGMSVNGSSNNVVSGNQLQGRIYLGGSTSAMANNYGNRITENQIQMQSDAKSQAAIWLQCNFTSANCNGNYIGGNRIIAASGVNSGIYLENDVCASATVDSTIVVGNHIGGYGAQAFSASACATNTVLVGNGAGGATPGTNGYTMFGTGAGGAFSVAAGATMTTVSTPAVTASSIITVTPNSAVGSILNLTCNSAIPIYQVVAINPGKSFAVKIGSAPVKDPACFTYSIVN